MRSNPKDRKKGTETTPAKSTPQIYATCEMAQIVIIAFTLVENARIYYNGLKE